MEKKIQPASGLSGDTEKKQVNTLLYCLGEEAEAVLRSTNLTPDEQDVYTRLS